MPILPNSYGSAAEVAAFVRVYTASGSFTTTTNPSLAAVENWINQVSAIMNAALAQYGFAVPVVQDDVKLTISAYVVQAVVDLCHASNTSGRFFTEKALSSGSSPIVILRQEIMNWVELFATGLEALGAERTDPTVTLGTVTFRQYDEQGEAITPVFQRKGFGNRFTDWTPGVS